MNNAGTCQALGPAWEGARDVWWRDAKVSLRGSYRCARAVPPGMIARRRGRIINMAGGIGRRPVGFASASASRPSSSRRPSAYDPCALRLRTLPPAT